MKSNKDIIKKLFKDVLNREDPVAVKDIISPDYHEQDAFPGQAQGIEGIQQRLDVIFRSFPDAQYKIEDMVSEDEKIAVRWAMNGTFKNKFLSIEPTGKSALMKGIDIYFIKDELIVSHCNEVDLSGLA